MLEAAEEMNETGGNLLMLAECVEVDKETQKRLKSFYYGKSSNHRNIMQDNVCMVFQRCKDQALQS